MRRLIVNNKRLFFGVIALFFSVASVLQAAENFAPPGAGAGAGAGVVAEAAFTTTPAGSPGLDPAQAAIIAGQAKEEDYATLKAWAQFIFTRRPEGVFPNTHDIEVYYRERLCNPGSPFSQGKQVVSGGVFISLIDEYLLKRANDFNQKIEFRDDSNNVVKSHSVWANRSFPISFRNLEAGDSFVEKTIIKNQGDPAQIILLMGDIHGSVHALLRNLLVMFQAGWLRDDFTLADNVNLVFLGDLTDRGLYGIESIFTVLKLKLATWDRVHIVRGNHENASQVERYGFFHEIDAKYNPRIALQIEELYWRFCATLPSAKFFGVDDGTKKRFIQCCHGGLAQSHDVVPFLKRSNYRRFEHIDDVAAMSYQWNDVCCTPGGARIPEGVDAKQDFLRSIETYEDRGSGISPLPGDLRFWMPSGRGRGIIEFHRDDITKIMAARNICMLMRGHQDDWGSCKVLAPDFSEDDLLKIQEKIELLKTTDSAMEHSEAERRAVDWLKAVRLRNERVYKKEQADLLEAAHPGVDRIEIEAEVIKSVERERRRKEAPRPWYYDDRFNDYNYANIFRQGVPLPDWANCTTLTTATEARGLESEGFMGIVLGNSLEDSSVFAYDAYVALPDDEHGQVSRNGKYVGCKPLPPEAFKLSQGILDLKSPATWHRSEEKEQAGLTPVLMGYKPRAVFMPRGPIPLVFGRGSIREAMALYDRHHPAPEPALEPELALALSPGSSVTPADSVTPASSGAARTDTRTDDSSVTLPVVSPSPGDDTRKKDDNSLPPARFGGGSASPALLPPLASLPALTTSPRVTSPRAAPAGAGAGIGFAPEHQLLRTTRHSDLSPFLAAAVGRGAQLPPLPGAGGASGASQTPTVFGRIPLGQVRLAPAPESEGATVTAGAGTSSGGKEKVVTFAGTTFPTSEVLDLLPPPTAVSEHELAEETASSEQGKGAEGDREDADDHRGDSADAGDSD